MKAERRPSGTAFVAAGGPSENRVTREHGAGPVVPLLRRPVEPRSDADFEGEVAAARVAKAGPRPLSPQCDLEASRAAWRHLAGVGLLDTDGHLEGLLRDLGGVA